MLKTSAQNKVENKDDLAALVAERERLTRQIERVRARGTGDHQEAARSAATPPLGARVEAALRREPMTTEQLCREVRAPAGPVTAARKRLKTYNIGSEERPIWTLVVGDGVSTQEAYAKVWQLIAIRPFESGELEAATGIRRGRVQGALVDAQRLGGEVMNAGGTRARWRWFLVRAPKR